MLDTIILLTSAVQQPILAAVLQKQGPNLNVVCAETVAELKAIDPGVLARARLVAFATMAIVPPDILQALGYGAYNFHPGPPTYPGLAPAPFAIYDGAATFGATAHRMTEQVDAGPIVDVDLFDVAPGTTLELLEVTAFSRLANLFWRLAVPLATSCEPLAEIPVQWSGRKSSRRLCASTCEIPLDISADELLRRVQAFGRTSLGVSPTITLHGFQFRIAVQATG